MVQPAVIDPVVDLNAELAGSGRALELAIATGRIGLPLSRRGVPVHGIELSRAMVAKLRGKPGGEAIDVTICPRRAAACGEPPEHRPPLPSRDVRPWGEQRCRVSLDAWKVLAAPRPLDRPLGRQVQPNWSQLGAVRSWPTGD
ncbi:MAG: hypothetical protein J2P17_17445 [Mycobacterium sp.]|nr:hypothetical protein [Mycobacterium sp.]